MRLSFVAVALLLVALEVPAIDLPNSPSKEAAREVIRTRRFAGKRDLVAYLLDFPPEFAEDLCRLGPKDRLLDAGAGAAYFSEEVVSLRRLSPETPPLHPRVKKPLSSFLETPLSRRPQVTAISLNLERENIPTYEGRLKILWGRFFGEIPSSELGKFDLITDMNGVFAYSPDADEVLRRYVGLLEPGGVIYLYLGEDARRGFAFQSYVKVKNGGKVTLADWVRSLPGLKVTLLEGSGGAKPAEKRTLRIEVADRDRVNIPRLALLGIDSMKDGPPTRVYWQR